MNFFRLTIITIGRSKKKFRVKPKSEEEKNLSKKIWKITIESYTIAAHDSVNKLVEEIHVNVNTFDEIWLCYPPKRKPLPVRPAHQPRQTLIQTHRITIYFFNGSLFFRHGFDSYNKSLQFYINFFRFKSFLGRI